VAGPTASSLFLSHFTLSEKSKAPPISGQRPQVSLFSTFGFETSNCVT
jgi:hypothetical protein